MLSLAGGGAKGAYEVGALHQLVQMLESPESHYDVVSGVSVGSINAVGAGLFGRGEEKEMAEFLMGLWGNLTNADVWQFWDSWNPVAGITDKAGFLDNSPLHDLLVRLIESKGSQFKKRVLVSANDAQTGAYVDFRLGDYTDPDLIASVVVGSASVPFFFPPRNMSKYGLDHLLVDSGFTWNLNMDSAVAECYQLDGITSPSQIVMDVMILSPDALPDFDGGSNKTHYRLEDDLLAECQKANEDGRGEGRDPVDCLSASLVPRTLKFLNRKQDIQRYYADLKDVYHFMEANHRIGYRYFLSPATVLLPEYELLQFGSKYTHKLVLRGMEDMKKVIEMGPGKSFDKIRAQADCHENSGDPNCPLSRPFKPSTI